jgi:hypothetical protein
MAMRAIPPSTSASARQNVILLRILRRAAMVSASRGIGGSLLALLLVPEVNPQLRYTATTQGCKMKPAGLRSGNRPAECRFAGRQRGSDLRAAVFVLGLVQRCAQNVAQRCAGVGRAILCDGFLLFGNFQRLDRQADLAVVLVELGDAGIDLLANGEALGPLLGAVTRQVGAADEDRSCRCLQASPRGRFPAPRSLRRSPLRPCGVHRQTRSRQASCQAA